MSSHPIVVAITGGSGAPYAIRLLQVLSRGKQQVQSYHQPVRCCGNSTRTGASRRPE